MTSLRYMLARWRLRRIMRPLDRQIAEARLKHRPVRDLMAAKTALIHAALAGRAG